MTWTEQNRYQAISKVLGLSKLCGIYEIVNKINNKRYVGSSVDLYSRFRNHKAQLNNATHENPILQRAWDKYGEDAFEFRVLLLCEKSDVLGYEQQMLDCSAHEYNIATNAYAPGTGRTLTEEHRRKISESQKGKTITQDCRAKLSLANKGHLPWNTGKKRSAETVRKMSEKRKGYPAWNKTNFTEADLENMKRLREEKYSYVSISKLYGVAWNTIRNRLMEYANG